MGVNFLHPEYKANISDWELLDDIFIGEKAVKAAGQKYLPALGGQEPEEYFSYKERGSFFNAFARTVQGLSGFIFRKPVKKNLPPEIENLLPKIMSTGQSFEELCTETTVNALKKGRLGLLVDSQDESDPYIALYKAESIINWKTEFIEGEEVLKLVCLQETYDVEGATEFDIEKKVQYRSLVLREDGVEVTVWRKGEGEKGEWVPLKTYFPSIRGKRQKRIMFFFIGGEKNTSDINKPPLIDMAYVNISHWRLSVDYYHGLHYCSLPTPWAAGFDSEEQQLTIGPVRVWVSDEPTAKCGYLEFTGQGLTAVKSAMKSSEEQMAILGARIIEQTRSRVETAEASKIRQSGESGALTTISNNVSVGLTHAMIGLAEWIGAPSEDIYVRLNTDFMDAKLESEEITSLVKSYQANTMSLDTLLWNFDRGELLPPGVTPEDEKARIELDKKDRAKEEYERIESKIKNQNEDDSEDDMEQKYSLDDEIEEEINKNK